MSSNDHLSPNVWIQTRRRIDVMMGLSCLAIIVVATWVSWPAIWKAPAFLPILGVSWHLMRRSIPPGGRVYENANIDHQHKAILSIAVVGLPWILVILAVDWLNPAYEAWWFGGIFLIFLAVMLRVATWLDRSRPGQLKMTEN